MNLSSAYLLVSHGSRDRRPHGAVEALAQMIRTALPSSTDAPARPSIVAAPHRSALLTLPMATPLVSTACLELAPQPLHQQIQQAAQTAQQQGYQRLVILPLFLLPGVHVRVDLPAEVKLAEQALGNSIDLHLCPHLGSHPGIEALLTQAFAAHRSTAKILLAHGSRRSSANHAIAMLTNRLQAVPAFWAVAPSLHDRVAELVTDGHHDIAIVPYFLFAGAITDAIAQTVADLQQQFPQCQLHLGEPLGATPELAALAIDLLTNC